MKHGVDWSALRAAVPGMSLGWQLALPVVIGGLVGHLLDRRLGTGYTLTVVLLFYGVATGIYSVIRFAYRLEAREKAVEQQAEEEPC